MKIDIANNFPYFCNFRARLRAIWYLFTKPYFMSITAHNDKQSDGSKIMRLSIHWNVSDLTWYTMARNVNRYVYNNNVDTEDDTFDTDLTEIYNSILSGDGYFDMWCNENNFDKSSAIKHLIKNFESIEDFEKCVILQGKLKEIQ